MHFFAKKFGHIKKKQYLCTRFWKTEQVFLHKTSPQGARWETKHLCCFEIEEEQLWRPHELRSNEVVANKLRRGAVVQLVRIPACHAVGREFESRPHRKKESQMWLLFCATDLNRASSPPFHSVDYCASNLLISPSSFISSCRIYTSKNPNWLIAVSILLTYALSGADQWNPKRSRTAEV